MTVSSAYGAKPARSAQSIRNGELAQIHLAKQQLGMDDESYRNVLWTVARVKSAADLDWSGRKRVLDHMKPLAMTKEAIEAKISMQLKELGQNWPYAYGVGRRIFPAISRFEFLDVEQLGKVSSALERTIRFRKQKENGNG